MQKKVLVFGSYVADIMSRSPRLPIPGETIKGSSFRLGCGGKGFNQAAAARQAGADVEFISKVGRDRFGEIALETIESMRIDPRNVIVQDEHATGIALIMVDENTSQNQIVVCIGACDHITAEDVERCRGLIAQADILLVQLETNSDALEKVVRLARENRAFIILNPAPAHTDPSSLYALVDIVTPNETEAAELTGITVETEAGMAAAAAFFVERGVSTVIITLGSSGIYLHTPAFKGVLPAFRVDALDTTGAGDAFNGALAAALAAEMDIPSAVRFAQAAAALCVTRLGASNAMPHRAEIDELLAST